MLRVSRGGARGLIKSELAPPKAEPGVRGLHAVARPAATGKCGGKSKAFLKPGTPDYRFRQGAQQAAAAKAAASMNVADARRKTVYDIIEKHEVASWRTRALRDVQPFLTAALKGSMPNSVLDALHSIPLVPRRVHPLQALGWGPRADTSAPTGSPRRSRQTWRGSGTCTAAPGGCRRSSCGRSSDSALLAAAAAVPAEVTERVQAKLMYGA